MPALSFARVHSYASQDASITVPVVLRAGTAATDLLASIDTGSSHCLFEASYAVELGFDLKSGLLMRFRTANSHFEAYGHEVDIEVLGVVTHSLVYFFADPTIQKNVLGRRGWMDRVRMGLVDHDREIYLAPYDYA
ncbi:MAG: hypothetical protein K2X03_14305 [Bryobacteraceae bacterium]|nr:hypothetical protein [Bryobacteraceae bacterium]